MSNIFTLGDKFAAIIDGKTVKRSNRRALERMLKRTDAAEPVVESKFTINQRFGFVKDMVTMLANGDQASVVVTGPGGLGKSHTVSAALRDDGINDVSVLDELDVGDISPRIRIVLSKVTLHLKVCIVSYMRIVTLLSCSMIVTLCSKILCP